MARTRKSKARLDFEEAYTSIGAFIVGVVLAPLLALYSFCKGFACFIAAPTKYFYEAFPKPKSEKIINPDMSDIRAKFMSGTFVLGRIGAMALTTVCVLGFVGAIATPLPGVAPLYTAGVAGILKAVGITIGYTIGGRTLGSAIGGFIFDRCKLNPICKSAQPKSSRSSQENADNAPKKMRSSTYVCFRAVVMHSLFGEAGFAAKKQLRINARERQASQEPSFVAADVAVSQGSLLSESALSAFVPRAPEFLENSGNKRSQSPRIM